MTRETCALCKSVFTNGSRCKGCGQQVCQLCIISCSSDATIFPVCLSCAITCDECSTPWPAICCARCHVCGDTICHACRFRTHACTPHCTYCSKQVHVPLQKQIHEYLCFDHAPRYCAELTCLVRLPSTTSTSVTDQYTGVPMDGAFCIQHFEEKHLRMRLYLLLGLPLKTTDTSTTSTKPFVLAESLVQPNTSCLPVH